MNAPVSALDFKSCVLDSLGANRRLPNKWSKATAARMDVLHGVNALCKRVTPRCVHISKIGLFAMNIMLEHMDTEQTSRRTNDGR